MRHLKSLEFLLSRQVLALLIVLGVIPVAWQVLKFLLERV